MAFDTILADGVIVLVVLMTVYGGILAVPPRERQWSHAHRWIFIVLGVVTASGMVWQNHRSDTAKARTESDRKQESQSLRDEITKLKDQLERTNVREQGDAVRRSEIRNGLGRLLAKGENFSNRCSGGILTPMCDAEWKAWKKAVRNYLQENLGIAFVARFDSAEVPGFPPYEVIGGELAEIKKILQELKG